MKTGGNARSILCLLCLLCSVPSYGQRILSDPKFKAAEEFVAKDHDRFVRDLIQITEIPAPPFKEEKRGRVYADLLKQSGVSDVQIDSEGNVIGLRKGSGNGPLIAIAAHLDTVFPEGTNVRVRR